MLKSTFAAATLLAAVAMQPAVASDLRDDAFITALNGNTLTDRSSDGKPLDVYFLPGGETSYQEANGQPHFGHWKLDRNSDVCITWAPGGRLENGCFKVAINGDRISFSNSKVTHVGGLLGGVETRK